LDREADVRLYRRFHVHEPDGSALHVEYRSTAVARFDGHGQLQHFAPVHFPFRGNDAGHYAVFVTKRISQDHNGGALLDQSGIA
jgi:hypothetical protein